MKRLRILDPILSKIKPSFREEDEFLFRGSDIFVTSYPRSGNTWLRFIIANLINHDREIRIDFHTVHHFIPDIEMSSGRTLAKKLKNPRILKTHREYDSRIRKAIYLLRDGRDVMVSYYHYLLGQQRISCTFLEFLERGPAYPCPWQVHVRSWLLRPESKTNLLFVRYEDMLRDPLKTVRQIAGFLGLRTDDQLIEEAISKSTFERMSQIEKDKGRAYDDTSTEFRFVRKGISGDWRNYFRESHKQIFKKQANDILVKFGYASDDNW